ncbi:MAG: N-acetyltransferase, partial [Chloroflexi bacterium]
MHIVDLRSENESVIRQVAMLLVEGFAANWPGSWPDLESAMEEVRESLAAGRISRVAFDEDGT